MPEHLTPHDHASAEGAPGLHSVALSRRTFLAGAAGVAAAGAAARFGGAPAYAVDGTKIVSGTDFSVAVSPDARLLALDALGVLWVMPSSGGTARRLTSDLYDIAQPDWSPDGSTLVFQSYRDGVFNLWTIRPDGSGARQHTQGPYDHREPRWSPDGTKIAYSTDEGGSYGLRILEVASGRTTELVQGPEDEYEPAWSPDGTKIAFVVADTRVEVVEVATGVRSVYAKVDAPAVIHQPSWLPDGSQIAYHLYDNGANKLMVGNAPLVEGEEVFPLRPSFGRDGTFYYPADGQIRVRRLGSGGVNTVGFVAALPVTPARNTPRSRKFDAPGSFDVAGIGSPVLSPDAKSIAFRALNDIYLMRIGEAPKPLFADSWWKCDPDWSADGKRLAYASDRSGTLNIWVRDVDAASDAQITSLTDHAALSPRWSPDGSEIAYLDEDGGLWAVNVTTRVIQKVFDATFEPGRPSWSPDGRFITLAAVKPYSKRYREGLSKLLVVNRGTGEGRYLDPAPDRSLQTRGDDGPVWSPDGRWLLFAMENYAWVMPVDATGQPTGAARKVTNELTDAPTWGGDSKTILYLSGGKLRLTSLDGGAARTVPIRLKWSNFTGPEVVVVCAGRMWDGTSSSVRRNVDIVIKGQRVVGVEDCRPGRPEKVIDASNRFVMPGLIEYHHHREMAGYAYGSRQAPLWLSLGITTTRSPGSPAYHMVEERESVQSGRRLAPRYLGTGEAVDGARIYYNFMRPTFSTQQVGMELDRAKALDYDLIKCYVRLRTEEHKRVIDWAHKRKIPVTSHYHYPAIAFGGDATEHIGATNRFGYSRTITNVGSGFSDVIDMFTASKMTRTPTLFIAQTLYKSDTSLVNDERTQRLYPKWRMAKLAESVTKAQTTDQSDEEANLRNQVAQIIAMLRGGGVVTAGTDAPIDHLAISLHMNLRAMVKYGVSILDALKSVTSVNGAALGEPLGRIAPGMLADLAIIDGDPMSNIADLAKVTGVVLGGNHHPVEELLAPYPSATATATPAAAPKRGGTQAVTEPAVRNQVVARVPVHECTEEFWWNSPAELAKARSSCCQGAHG